MREGNYTTKNNKVNEPYFEALSFYTKDKNITDNYANNYKQLNVSQNILEAFIEYFKNYINKDNEKKKVS